jgi:peptidyl-prolyl cis-trans isomerase C
MKKSMKNFVIFLVTLLAITGCKKNDPSAEPTANTNPNVLTSPAAPHLDKENTMIATVNGTTITTAEVEQELSNLLAQYQNSLPPDQLQLMRPKMKTQAIENLINRQVLLREAGRKEIKPSSEDISAEMNTIVSRFPSPEVFEQQLTQMGITKDKMIEDIGLQLKINILVKEVLADVQTTVTDQETSEFYQANPENFRAPEQVRASHILLKTSAEASPEVKSQKRLELAGLRGKIQNGADFAKLAGEHSECPSKQQGGDLGFMERGKMVKPFEEAAFNLKTDELSDIVETQFGYHLIKVVDRKEARTVPLEEAKDKIAEYLKSTKEQQAFNTYMEKLRESASIKYAEAGQ